jgi:hypothetical protein
VTCPTSSPGSSRRSFDGFKVSLSDRIVPWILLWTVIFCAAVVVGSLTGCAARTVLVPEAAPVRVGPDVRARVYVRVDGEWILSDNRVPIQEGWYLVPPSYVEEE